MKFANPDMLWILAGIVPALMAFLWWSRRRRHFLIRQFVQSRLLASLTVGVSARRQLIKSGKHNHQSYGIRMSTDRIKMFNLETTPSVIIDDLFENEQASGTRVTVKLTIK